jgi:hypothetical protein
MKTIFSYAVICITLLLAACSSSTKENVTPDVRATIVDKYWCPEITGLVVYYFKSDGTYQQALEEDKTKAIAFGTWTLSGSTIKMVDKSGAGIDTDMTVKNLSATSVTFDTILGDFAYKVCK